MRKFLAKIFSKETLVTLLILMFFAGIIFYVEYRFKAIRAEIKVVNTKFDSSDKYIQELRNVFLGATSDINNVLTQEQEKNSVLKDQFNEITNTVGALEKLSATDPELLKKYSKVYFLNEHYVPISLTNIDAKYLNKKSTNFQFHSDALHYLENLIDAANNEEDFSLQVLSAYRSFATQSILKANYKITYGVGTANKFSADQGYSEHQLGTTLDFSTEKTNGALEGFDKTPEYKWLKENAYKYGFIISYPTSNTYYKFEPWHWRFVGVALATRLHDDDMYFYGMDQRIIDIYLANIFD